MELKKYTCPACGGALSCSDGKAVCSACGGSYDSAAIDEYTAECAVNSSRSFSWTSYDEKRVNEFTLPLYGCKNCGAEFYATAENAPKECPYCRTKTSFQSESSQLVRPDIVVPFRQSRQDALSAFHKFIRRKMLLPNEFSFFSDSDMQGVYVPYWICGSTVNGKFRFDCVKQTAEREKYREDHFMVIREGGADFSDIAVSSSAIDGQIMQTIMPYDLHSNDYDMKTLLDYLTEKTINNPNSAIEKADKELTREMKKLFSDTVSGYSSSEMKSAVLSGSDGTLKLALLPVWVFTQKRKNRTYRFVMNGQTGKFFCELPTSKAKMAAVIAVTAAVVTLVGSVVTLLI